MKVGIIDYGVGNFGSVLRSLEELRVVPALINRPVDMRGADCLILPGVGSFADCANQLNSNGWTVAIRDEVLNYGRPLLGICLGMQLLADNGMEGVKEGQSVAGLGLIPGRVQHLSQFGCAQRVPHVGWNSITRTPFTDPLFDGIPNGTDFYFVHSYAFEPTENTSVLATTDYGVQITAAVRCGNVWGTQFHPEKSSRAGSKLLQNFIESFIC